MKKIFEEIVLNWYAYVMLIISYAFSFISLLRPEIFRNIPPDIMDDVPSHMFDPHISAIMLITFSSIYLFGRLIKNGAIKLSCLIGLNILWLVTAVSLFWRFVHGVPSATFLLSIAMFLIGIGQALRGDYSHE